MRPRRGSRRLGALLVAAATLLLAAGAIADEPAKPRYLPYLEFAADDAAPSVALKQAYNDAVKRYNEALYDYHVTLERHNQLVDFASGPGASPAERQKAREEAAPLRARLDALRRDVLTRAAAVDAAARRAAAGGVTVTR